MKKRKLAIFDVDGTITRWHLVFVLFEQLAKKGIFPPETLEQTIDAYMGWLNREKVFSEYDNKVTEIFHTYAKGVSEESVLAVADDIIENKRYKVYRYSYNLIHKLRKEGYYIVLISGSPGFIVKKLAVKLRCDRAYGKLFEVINGRFTGKVKYGEDEVDAYAPLDKTVILKRLFEVIDFEPDLKNSISVGDSLSDLPILEAVGNPVVFNPTLDLTKIARERQWKIVVERKDVIYEVKDFEMIDIDTS